MTINLTQIRSDFDNGIIVSKQTLLALVDYAIELEKKQQKYEMCGGCGNSDPESRCINCRHEFAILKG